MPCVLCLLKGKNMKKTITAISVTIVFLIFILFVSLFIKNTTTNKSKENINTESVTTVVQTESTIPESSVYESETTENKEENEITLLIQNMTIEEKIGQLFIIRPQVLDFCYETVSEGTRLKYSQYPAGGFVLFSNNIYDPEQLTNFTNELHSLSETLPPLITIDEEGGSITRIASSDFFDVEVFDDMETIAQDGNEHDAENLGFVIGNYLMQYGIDLDFAPVADVNTNPSNPVIGCRAFGSDPVKAGKMVSSAVNGFHKSGEKCCIKHFPGHGDTNSDTHTGFAETLKNWEELKECEMIPFIDGINSKTDMVMAAHISVPNVTGTDIPASLSEEIVTNKLRNELGFDGVIITDSMEMGAVTDRYSSSEAAVKAISAGVDIILMPENYEDAFNGIREALNEGIISEERIDESLMRILKLKNKPA